ncbi:hypothetical protein H6G80_17655 [Nostoc sp. FACHB-87]|uniref:hypothetical protein n=1 Tax=Nostocales TaxID=1161 RepID=UPI001681EEE4|nr:MULTISPECIES: hypothetical protein [Nostocales]MBD2298547.1 hypothetical protein [Nostoc sp. FACHB-190]MBD2455898.1 hypothetical protein [Nostoc sp. FACHB-87]MBD2474484.1 hypothetical protein [Anabaena sp. FACHB-83]MBD2486975.1 hypothetical protein [Aulosira sp. FACHB-615]
MSCQKSLPILLGFSLGAILLLPISPSLAEIAAVPLPSDAPLELDLLTKPNSNVITANTINPQGLTTPSLWLAQANSESKLLDNWIAYPATATTPGRVDVIVNQQVWSILDYLERYSFINRLGNVARKDVYNLRVFNYQQELLGSYTCNFQTNPTSCRIQINSLNRLVLQQSSE